MSTSIHVHVNQIGPATSEGTARTHRVLIDRPPAKGGEDRGAMGGELLLMGLGGCFMSNLLAAIRARAAAVANIMVTVVGTLEDNPSRFTSAELKVRADYEDAQLMEKLLKIAERGCLTVNTLRGALSLSITLEAPEGAPA